MNPTTFSDLKLMPSLLKAVEEEGYTSPSPIQEKAIPPVLEGRDLVGCAQTGTGKTAAFALPILQRLTKNPLRRSEDQPGRSVRPIRALILTPTRELALQIQESFEAYGRHTHLRSAVIFGGVSQVPQVAALQKGIDILVATPGRLNDLIGQGHIHLKQLEIFVLDEADRMLDMGFVHDVKKVISQLPARRQSLLFSATMPDEIARLADSLLTDPVHVAVAPVSSTVDAIEQSVYFVDKANKPRLLLHLLEDPSIRSALVFTRTKHGADRVVKELSRAGVQALAIHGNKSQNARQNALGSFKSGRVRVLVATDIAARGIDVDELSHVINFDLPNIPETYVHRIGRTGRAGLSGTAISFCDFEEKAYLKDIEKLIRKTVPVIEKHPYPMEVFEILPKPERPPRPPRQNNRTPVNRESRDAKRSDVRKPVPPQPNAKPNNRPNSAAPANVKKNPDGNTKKSAVPHPAAPRGPQSAANKPTDKRPGQGTPPSRNRPDVAPVRTAERSQNPGAPKAPSAPKSPSPVRRSGFEPAITKKPRPIRPFQSRSAGTDRDFLPKKDKE